MEIKLVQDKIGPYIIAKKVTLIKIKYFVVLARYLNFT